MAGVESQTLIQTHQSWDGANLPKYPKGTTELIIKRYTFPPKAVLDKHYHKLMSCGIVEKGELTLVSADGKEKTFSKGEAFVEMVGTIHHGENREDMPLEVVVFYVGKKGVPLSIK